MYSCSKGAGSVKFMRRMAFRRQFELIFCFAAA
jgi:hypothetical protein